MNFAPLRRIYEVAIKQAAVTVTLTPVHGGLTRKIGKGNASRHKQTNENQPQVTVVNLIDDTP